jgi:dihydrofolate reductase
MRKLVAGTFLTLDGVMQAPGNPDEDREGGFKYGGWMVPFFDDKFEAIMTDWIKRADAFLLGRKTYEIFAAFWPKSTDPADEIAKALNTRPKYVASRTLSKLSWNNSTLLNGGDVADAVAKLKAQDGGEIQVHGSGKLLQTLFKHDLVDTLRIWQAPVIVGTGKHLFGEGLIARSLRLVDTEQTARGAFLHVYERAGGLKVGEVDIGQEPVVFETDAA